MQPSDFTITHHGVPAQVKANDVSPHTLESDHIRSLAGSRDIHAAVEAYNEGGLVCIIALELVEDCPEILHAGHAGRSARVEPGAQLEVAGGL